MTERRRNRPSCLLTTHGTKHAKPETVLLAVAALDDSATACARQWTGRCRQVNPTINPSSLVSLDLIARQACNTAGALVFHMHRNK